MSVRFSIFTLLLLFVVSAYAAPALKTDRQKYSYGIGVQVAHSLKRDGIDVDLPAMQQAIADVMSDTKLRLSDEEMRQAFAHLQEQKKQELAVMAGKNQKAGNEFQAKNKKQAGVKVLPDGVQYKVIKAGTGKTPTVNDRVTVHYRGKLINGEEFDSSYSRGEPATFPVNGVIKGWQEVLPMMKEGGHWQVVIPPELAYGDRGAGAKIGPNATLVFDIELLKVL